MIYITSDHKGYEAKNQISEYFNENQIEFTDLGPDKYNPNDDYPDFAFQLGKKVVENNAKGIIICGSGIGVSIAANKVDGIRAGYVESKEHAIKARTDDDTNVLVLDTMTFDPQKDFEIIQVWLNTPFSNEERHARRLKKISLFEKNN